MASVIKAGNATDGIAISSDNTGILELKTGTGAGTTAMTVDTSQNVGIGTTSPTSLLHLYRNGVGATTCYLQNASTSAGSYATLAFDAGVVTSQLFSDATGAAVAQGAVLRTVSNHPLIFGTNSAERARFNAGAPILCLSGGNTSATGTGIAFPATQSASSDANTLDDYEEGTFTPVIVGTTTAGTGTYSTQYGVYTKIGRTVAVRISLRWSAHTGSGNMRLNGLPFTSGGGGDEFAIPSFFIYNIALSANNVITGYIGGAATSITIEQIATGGGTTAGVAMDTSGEFYATATYFV